MAYFKSNKVETRIANILKGTSDPSSSIGDNGQLYLKYIDIADAYSLREYIEVGNAAGPYINTRLYWSQSNEFEVKAQFMAEPENDTFVFGCWVSYLDTNIAYGNGWQIMVGGSGITGQQYDTNAHVYKAEQNSLLLDGSVLSGTPNWNNVPTNVPIAIFTDGARLTEKRIKNTRVYYAKIWDNGELTHYFVPAIRKSDDEIGMLDIMTSTFYDNDGSGDFTISSTERTDIEGKPITSSFAKVNGTWQDLIDTEINDILAGGSKYIKATGSFTSASSGGQKVEVNCGFKPDLVMVDMEFGNGFTRATYLSTAWYEETDHPASVWDLRPMENVIYAIVPGSVNGETGITDLTDTGFKYRSNGSNTTNKDCTYTAIKFDAEEQTEDRTYLFKDGEWKNQDILSLYGYNTTIENGSLKCTGVHAGVVVDDVSGLDSSVTQYSVYLKVRAGNVNSFSLQTGRNVPTQNLYDIIQYGTDRYSYNTDYISSGTDYLFVLIALSNTDGVFLGAQNADENAYYYIDEIWLETSAQVIVHS